jgi:hypothetical protein
MGGRAYDLVLELADVAAPTICFFSDALTSTVERSTTL